MERACAESEPWSPSLSSRCVGTACVEPLSTKGNTDAIQLVSTTTAGGWKYDFYRNNAYPCSVSGYQTFVIGTKVGVSDHAGGPALGVHARRRRRATSTRTATRSRTRTRRTRSRPAALTSMLKNNGLIARVKADAAGFRVLAVSYCSHEVYGGVNSTDPHNPNKTSDGKPRTTNGILATKAAIQYAQALSPTTKTFLHGGSAGSAGSYYMAWSMQQQGIPPAGVVADASVVNRRGDGRRASPPAICTDDNDPNRGKAIAARVHPDIANIDNEADKLVSSGQPHRAAAEHLEPRRPEHLRRPRRSRARCRTARRRPSA